MMILTVFRARAESLDYAERLRAYGVDANTMPTPKEAKIGCGLCVRFDPRNFTRANAVLRAGRYSTFKGYYQMDYVGGRPTVTPFYYR